MVAIAPDQHGCRAGPLRLEPTLDPRALEYKPVSGHQGAQGSRRIELDREAESQLSGGTAIGREMVDVGAGSGIGHDVEACGVAIRLAGAT